MSLAYERTGTVGLLIGSTTGIYAKKLLSNLVEELHDKGMQLVSFHCDFLLTYTEDINVDHIILRLIKTHQVDAMIIAGMVSEAVLQKVTDAVSRSKKQVPVVSVTFASEATQGVLIDNASGMKELMSHLLDEHGYERLAFIGGPPGQQEAETRKQVFVEELQRRNLPIREDWFAYGNFLPVSGTEAIKQLIEGDDASFQGVVVASDEMAVSAMRYLESVGLRVPEDYFITGFDGFKSSPLTTVHQSMQLHMREVVARIQRILAAVDQKQSPQAGCGVVTWVPSSLRLGSSCGCLPSRTIDRTRQAMANDEHLQGCLQALHDACISSLQQNDDADFLSTLSSFLSDSSLVYFSMHWESLLSILRSSLITENAGELDAHEVHRLIDQGFMLITAAFLGKEDLKKFHRESQPFKMQRLNQQLSYVLQFDQMLDVLADALPKFGFSSAALSSLEEADGSGEMARLRMAYDSNGRVGLAPAGIVYPLEDLLPSEVALAAAQHEIRVVQPLVFQENLLGVMIVSADIAAVTKLFIISSYISNAIRSIGLWEDRIRSEERMIQTEKMAALGKLVAGIAHEINTPIGIGLTTASDLSAQAHRLRNHTQNGTLTRTIFEDFLQVLGEETSLIEKNLYRAGNLIRSFKKIAVDQSSEETHEFELKQYIEDIVTSLRPKLKTGRYSVEIECPDQLTMFGPPGTIAQVISNLISNSIVHGFAGRPEGTISIVCKKQAETVFIHYADDGAGMEENIVQNVFEPFFTTTMGQGGSGLGLHIVYNLICKIWNGSIRCDSAPGAGTQFSITLQAGCRQP